MSDTDKEGSAPAALNASFEGALNRHGHPFQYAVLRRVKELADARQSRWRFEASEFPVAVKNQNTRIDFVLRQTSEDAPDHFLVAECKRANPSLSDWLFARAPYVRRSESSPTILFEKVRTKGRTVSSSTTRPEASENVYHIAIEVKGTTTGDAGGSGRGTIEDAAGQVVRGVNGLIECLAQNLRLLPTNANVTFVPVIFTTARIWATEVDLGSTDLASGRVALGAHGATEKPWLWLQYHVSPSLRHSVPRALEGELSINSLGHFLAFEYARSIAVVSPSGIDAFLTSMLWD